jgi:valyl-tRNA synthetase
LESQGTSRLQLGREKFLERVWQWKEEFGGKIIEQLKRMGASCDWSRERFTMDPGLSRAVREVFVSLYEEGLIYRGDYVINWCPHCHTAISDIEVEHQERDDLLYYIVYKGANGGPDFTVATTRPETMFGDTAVAINPNDPRYPQKGELFVHLPLTNRIIPIVRDNYVEMDFGTGALKVTPAHDQNDFHIGRRHNLEMISAIDKNGILTEAALAYKGLDRDIARQKVVEDLEKMGFLVKTEPLKHSVGVCYRCRTIIEPLLSLQWFLKCDSLAKAAKESVKSGKIALIPESWERTFFDWMDNIRDWCISRQLWWGHQIPAWYCQNCNEIIVSREDPTICPKCGAKLERDQDVLDTWFSSALWPFSTLGWPDDTKDLRRYYPTTVLVTGFDIIFFWVARMMMMGLKMMREVPFHTVMLHPLVRDAKGQKMSKSKKNVIDPLTFIDEYGADAFRFSLASQAGTNRDLKISKERVAGASRFVNKIWNAARFTLSHLTDFEPQISSKESTGESTIEGTKESTKDSTAVLSLPDRWIKSRINLTTKAVIEAIEEFHLDKAADAVYHFLWDEFCDWYLELIKPVLNGDDQKQKNLTKGVLYEVFSQSLKLLHPVMPFVSEELWGKLPGARDLLVVSEFPIYLESSNDPDAEREIGYLMDVTKAVRLARADFRIAPTARLAPLVSTHDDSIKSLLNKYSPLLLKLMGAETLLIAKDDADKPLDATESIFAWGRVWTPLSGQIDLRGEEMKLKKDLDKLSSDINKSKAKLSNPGYVEKAPLDVVEETRERLEEMELRLSATTKSLTLIGKLLKDLS